MPRGSTDRKRWKTVAFGDVVQLSKERSTDPESDGFDRFVGLEHVEPDELCIRSWGNVEDGTTFTSVFRPGQVLFGKRRAYQRKVAVPDFEGVCSGDLYVLEPRGKSMSPELLPFVCQADAFFEHAVRTSAGSLSPRTNWSSLADYKFELPPLDEQLRLAGILLDAARVVSATRKLLEAAAVASRALSAQLFSKVFSDTSVDTLGDVFDQVIDRGHGNLPILSVTIDGKVVRRESLERHVSDETGDEKYLRVLAGDIAYNTMRLWQGSVGIVREQGLISPAYTVMRPRTTQVSLEFLLEMLRSPALQQQYRRFVTGVASDRWRLYYKDLSKMQIVMPEGVVADFMIQSLAKVRTVETHIRNRLLESQDLIASLRRRVLGR